MLYSYNVVSCAALMYYTLNCKRFNQRYLQSSSNRSIYRVMGIATAQAVR